MKALVVYYSRTGNTRAVALALEQALGADTEEVMDKKRRSGPVGFLAGGKDAMLCNLTEIKEIDHDPSAYDIVILGTPVWANKVTPAIRTYLSEHKESIRKAAFFLTTASSGIENTFTLMETLAGVKPVATLALKDKLVKHNAFQEDVNGFAQRIRDALATEHNNETTPTETP